MFKHPLVDGQLNFGQLFFKPDNSVLFSGFIAHHINHNEHLFILGKEFVKLGHVPGHLFVITLFGRPGLRPMVQKIGGRDIVIA
jgi:hypothetical protein